MNKITKIFHKILKPLIKASAHAAKGKAGAAVRKSKYEQDLLAHAVKHGNRRHFMNPHSKVIVTVATLLLSGCAAVGFVPATPGVNPYEQQLTLAKEQAIVLVGIDSDVPLGRVLQACSWPCVAPAHALGGRKDILAFTVNVGTAFKLASIQTLDARIATLRGEELKIERHGVYYYGTIKGDSYRVGLGHGVSPYFLLAAKRKFGSRFDGLEAVNFNWPPPTDDRRIRFGYPISTSTQTALRSLTPKRLQLMSVVAAAAFDPKCREVGPLSLPEFLHYEEYIRRAFNAELDASQMYGDGPGSVGLKGTITELVFSSKLGSSFWRVGLRLETPNGQSFTVALTEPVNSAFNAGQGCANVEDAFPEAVQKLIELAVDTPDFRALMSTPAAQQ